MKIALFELEDWEKNFFQKKLSTQHDLHFFDSTLSEKNVDTLTDAEGLVIFIYSSVTREIIDKLPNLKFISTMSTGVDHIDTEYAKEKGVTVSNVSGYGEITVAEHTFALILALSRRVMESYKRVKDRYFSPEGLTGFDLHGRTLGIIGVGSIGRHVIQIANGFGMNIIAYTHNPDEALAQELGFKFVSLEELYGQSDIISLHVPYSKETHHLINEETVEKMKNGVYIINTARGGIIDTTAILKGIETGKIGGVGLDVCEGEPALREEKQLLSHEFDQEALLCIFEEQMLLNYPNVIITPHNAFNSREALQKIITTTLENIERFTHGQPQNTV